MKAVEITYRYEADTPSRHRPSSAEAARGRLEDGNRAFAALLASSTDEHGLIQHVVQVDLHELGLQEREASVPVQRPFAAVLGCSDARVPVELIFGEGPNDLFVVRVAGNALSGDVLGSLKYAETHLGDTLRLIVVLGHSGCGALTAAVDVFLSPTDYLPIAAEHSLRGILDRLLVVVQASARTLTAIFGPDVASRPGYREALTEASIVINAALAAYSLQQELKTADSTTLRAMYGVYLLERRELWAPRVCSNLCAGLASPPDGPTGFADLGRAIARSDRIARLVELLD